MLIPTILLMSGKEFVYQRRSVQMGNTRPENFWLVEAPPGIEPGYTDLQSAASPLRHRAMPEAGLLATFRPACNLPISGLCAFIADCMSEAAC